MSTGRIIGKTDPELSADFRRLGKVVTYALTDMNRVELLTVTEAFRLQHLAGSMLILHPNFSVPHTGWRKLVEVVAVVKPNGQRLEAAAEISMAHFRLADPDASMDRRWRVVVHLMNNSKEEVPIGSKVLVSPAVRDALLS